MTAGMPKDTSANRQQMRSRIAHLAARMIAEDGVSDYVSPSARPRGKPARPTRATCRPTSRSKRLRAYQQLYQADEHPERLQHLREVALDMMRLLAEFSPHLTGRCFRGPSQPP